MQPPFIGSAFKYVDNITYLDDSFCKGSFHFREDLPFYQAHFEGYPITPGVILIECAGQTGCIPLGYSILEKNKLTNLIPVLSNCEIDFFKPVFPGESVTVESEKVYFRKHILKCNVKMFKANGILVLQGNLSCKFLKKDDIK